MKSMLPAGPQGYAIPAGERRIRSIKNHPKGPSESHKLQPFVAFH